MAAACLLRAFAAFFIAVVLTVILTVAHKAFINAKTIFTVESGSRAKQGICCAVFLIAAVGTVLKAVAAEAANDAVDPASAGEERGTAFGFGFR